MFYLLPVLVVVQIIYGYNHLTEPWQGLSDSTGAFYNTGIFGGLVALGFVTGLGLIVLTKPQKYYIDKILLGIILIPITIQLIYSQSRAAWLAAIAGIIVLLFPVFRKLTKITVVVLISVLLIFGILFSVKLYHFKKDSADGRLLIWTVSWNLFKEKPLTGFGPDGFQKNYMFRQGDYLKEHPDSPWADLADDTTSPFNEFLKVAVEQGIIGLLFVFGIVFVTAKAQKSRKEQAVLTALIVFACFSYPFSFIAFQIVWMVCLASIANKQEAVLSFRGLWVKSAMTVFVVTVGFSLYSLCKYQQAVKQWNKATAILEDKTIPELQALYPILKHNALFVFIYGNALYYAERHPEAIIQLEEALQLYPNSQTLLRLGESYEKTGNDAKALDTWQIASYMKPSSFTPHYNIAKLYYNRSNCRRAKEVANKVLTKKMKINHPKIDWMKQEMREFLDCNSTRNKID
ncbi:ligase [Bacteroidia bacterium]|nr:ligase [Bacteroidia bacterium]